jgi:hypothetical protein
MSNISRSSSRNLFKSKVNRDDSFNKLNDSFSKQKSFNLSKEIQDNSINKKVNTMLNLQSVIEEPNNLIDDKLKRLVDSHKVANANADLMKKGSIRSLLSIAINSTYVFTTKKQNKFDICREYMKYLQ